MKSLYTTIAILTLITHHTEALAAPPKSSTPTTEDESTTVDSTLNVEEDTDNALNEQTPEGDNPVFTEAVSLNNDSTEILALTDEEALAEYERAQYFLKAFGKEMPSTFYPHDMQIVLDQTAAMFAVVEINPYTQSVQFDSGTLIPFLMEHLLPTPLEEALGIEPDEILSEGTLQQIGFQLQVDMKRQMITLTSPLAFRKNVNIYLRPQTRIVTFQPKGVRPLSGYVNMSHAFNHAGLYNSYNGMYNMNVNWKDWVFQSDFQYNSVLEQGTTVTGGRVVKDLPNKRIRMTLGDNSSPNTDLFLEKPPLASGFQEPIFGLDISHVGQFDRMRRRANDFIHLLFVEEISRVSIEVNGVSVYNEIMVPGKYELQDFPFQTGRNDIFILQVSESGAIQEEQVEYFHNPSMLPKGQKEYQLVSGLPYNDTNNLAQMNFNRYTNLAYFRYGLTDKIGTTAYLQTVNNSIVLGTIGEYGFGSNIASMELAYSNNERGQTGTAMRLQAYSSNSNYFTEGLNFVPNYYTLNVDIRSPNFDANLKEIAEVNDIRSIISPSLIWQLTTFCQFQFSAIIRDSRDTKDTQALEMRSYYRTKQWLFDVSLERSFGTFDNDVFVFVNATWRPKGSQRNRMNYRYNDRAGMHSLSANLWPEKNNFTNYRWQTDFIDSDNVTHDAIMRYQDLGHTWATRINRSTNGGLHSHEVTLDYDGPRALVDVSHTRPAEWYPTTTMNVNTAVAFVGKHWGISRPINESFAILFPNNEGLKDSTIRFQNGSILNKYSPAVYPFLGNYQTYEMGIQSAEVPIGLDLGPQQYFLNAGLNSGQAIPVGKPGGIIMATAVMLQPNGQPFDLEVGHFTNVKNPELSVQFFTNRTGRLYVQGLKSGDYTIEFVGNKYTKLIITIPKDAESPLDLGTIMLQPQQKEQ